MMWEVMYACIALHNYIRVSDSSSDYDLEVTLEDEDEAQDNDLEENVNISNENDYGPAKVWRDQIALQMWEAYIHRQE